MIDLDNILAMFAIAISLSNLLFLATRSSKADHKNDSVERTTIIVRLETIIDKIKDLWNMLTKMEQAIGELKDRVYKVEAKVDQAHLRIDKLEGKE